MVEIYTDGCCHGNPGKGGYGVILTYEKENGDIFEKEISQGYENTTNNRMELLAAIIGLEALKRPCDVKLYSEDNRELELKEHIEDGIELKIEDGKENKEELFLLADEEEIEGMEIQDENGSDEGEFEDEDVVLDDDLMLEDDLDVYDSELAEDNILNDQDILDDNE